MAEKYSYLVEGLKRGDPLAQKEFVEAFKGKLLRFLISRMALQEEDALEVLNDTFYKVIKNIDSFDPLGPAKFQTWVYQIATNAAIDWKRKNEKYRTLAYSEFFPHGMEELEDEAGSRPEIAILQESLDKLGEKDRNILLWWAYGFTYKETSQWLDGSPSVEAIKTAKSRALDKLKKAYWKVLESKDISTQERIKGALRINFPI